MRQVVCETFRDDFGEHHAELEVVATEPAPGNSPFQPPDPGWIESMSLVVDGVEVTDFNAWRWLVDRMLSH